MNILRKYLTQNTPLPTPFDPITDTNQTLVAHVAGANYTVYDVPTGGAGWYYVDVMGAAGSAAYKGEDGPGGRVRKYVYLYEGTSVLLWGAGVPNTGFPAPSDTLFGGRGYAGASGGESGGGGGAAAGNGTSVYSSGGGGAGVLCGFKYAPNFVKTNEASGFTTNFPLNVGTYNVRTIYAAFLCGGGGGACSDEGEPRSSGAGGGAWGDGGTTYNGRWGTTGPGGTFGKGGNGGQWEGSPGGNGGWACINFTTDEFTSGTGGGNKYADGFASLYKVERTHTGQTDHYGLRIVFPAFDTDEEATFTLLGQSEQTIFESSVPGTYSVNIPATANYNIILVGAGGGGGYYYYNGVTTSDWYSLACGGSGGYTNVVATLPSGTISVIVGAGGAGKNNSQGISGGNTTAGNYSAGGGEGGLPGSKIAQFVSTSGRGGDGGTGLTQNGNTGAYRSGGAAILSDTASVYGGYGFGGGIGSNSVRAGGNGYAKLVATVVESEVTQTVLSAHKPTEYWLQNVVVGRVLEIQVGSGEKRQYTITEDLLNTGIMYI